MKLPSHRRTTRRFARGLLVLILATCFGASVGGLAASGVRREGMDGRGMLKVDGRPRFVLGLYENPANDRDLEDAIAAGFNLFQCAPDPVALDRLARFGAKAWVNVGDALDLGSDVAARKARLAEIVGRVANHPALLVWEGPDEILWNQWWVPMETVRAELKQMRELAGSDPSLAALAETARKFLERGLYDDFQRARDAFWLGANKPCPNPGIRPADAPKRVREVGDGVTAGLRYIRSLDPKHVLWLNHAPRNSLEDLAWFNREADMVGCDIYPAPANLDVGHSDLTDMSLASVGAYTRRMRAAGPGRACAMVLQGFGWQDLRSTVDEHRVASGIGRRPGFSESRFMAYEAVLHGANAILYWGTAYAKRVGTEEAGATGRPRLWHDLLRVAREIRALEPAWLAKPEKPPTVHFERGFGSHDTPGFVVSLRRVGDDVVLCVANESVHGRRFGVERLPSSLNGRTLFRLGAPDAFEVREGRF
ncbi:MAG: hypothetical protein JNL97_10740, partial [Verrucomicrobiales bacterium]|nr:hypothetical protein [Verrucomicrobiales bacterium]